MSANKKKSEFDILAKRSYEVKVGDREVIVRPLVLREYSGLFDSLLVLLDRVLELAPDIDLESLEKFRPEQLIAITPIIPDICKVLDKILQLPEGYLWDHCDLHTLSKLIVLELSVNDVGKIIANFKLTKALVGKKPKGNRK